MSTWIINGTDGPAASFGGINLAAWEKASATPRHPVRAARQGRRRRGQQHLRLPVGRPARPPPAACRCMMCAAAGTIRCSTGPWKRSSRRPDRAGCSWWSTATSTTTTRWSRSASTAPRPNSLGIRMQDIGESLAVLVGENYVNRFGMEAALRNVIPQSLRDQRFHSASAGTVRAHPGRPNLMPLSTVVRVELQVRTEQADPVRPAERATLRRSCARRLHGPGGGLPRRRTRACRPASATTGNPTRGN